MINDKLNEIAKDEKNTSHELAAVLLAHLVEIPDMTSGELAGLAGCSEDELLSFIHALNLNSYEELQRACDDYHKAVSEKHLLFDINTSLAENIEELTERKLQTIRDTTLHLGQDRMRELADAALNSQHIYIYAQGETRPLAHYLRTAMMTMDMDVILTDQNLLKDYKAEPGDLFIFLSIMGQSFRINPNIMAKVDRIRSKKWLITCNHDIDFRGHRWVIPVKDTKYSEFAMQHALDLLIALMKGMYEKGL
jgi:DNA-binding MurR/RpiR family transcriptional regulator